MPSLLPRDPPRGEDLPFDDGEPMESKRHRDQMNLLIAPLEQAWRDRNDFFVAGNMAIYFSETQARNQDFRAPDFFLVLDTSRRERKSWVVWEEDGRTPDVVIEITSESTEELDRGRKKDIYARVLRVPFYAIHDPFSGRFDAFRLDALHRDYVPLEPLLGSGVLEPDERGRVLCEPLGVVRGARYGIEAPWLRWMYPDGTLVSEPAERAEREAERAEREAERAEREAERADRAEAELARLRAELAKKR